jgi:hypothetical protein
MRRMYTCRVAAPDGLVRVPRRFRLATAGAVAARSVRPAEGTASNAVAAPLHVHVVPQGQAERWLGLVAAGEMRTFDRTAVASRRRAGAAVTLRGSPCARGARAAR